MYFTPLLFEVPLVLIRGRVMHWWTKWGSFEFRMITRFLQESTERFLLLYLHGTAFLSSASTYSKESGIFLHFHLLPIGAGAWHRDLRIFRIFPSRFRVCTLFHRKLLGTIPWKWLRKCSAISSGIHWYKITSFGPLWSKTRTICAMRMIFRVLIYSKQRLYQDLAMVSMHLSLQLTLFSQYYLPVTLMLV